METEDLIPGWLLRVLRYVALVDQGGALLSDRDINAYAGAAIPEPPKAMTVHDLLGAAMSFSALREAGLGLDRREVEVAKYFATVGWISADFPRLTDVGRAVVEAVADRVEARTEAAVVLSPDDPLNLGLLTREIAAARNGLLVDPYFSDDLFEWLYSSTSLSRVLLCRRPENLAVLSLFLGGVERAGERALEVRYLEPRELHDRYLVASDGTVSMIGASLNGLHRNFTALVRLPDPAAEAIRARVEEDWNRAARVVPQDIKAELSVPASDPADDQEFDVEVESAE